MGKSLRDIAQELKESDKKVHLIYAFNGTGKTRLSKEFTKLVTLDEGELTRQKILYYNAFTEDLFYWDNEAIALKIWNNYFMDWILKDQGQDGNIIKNFQQYTNDKLMPNFNFSDRSVTFTIERGNEEIEDSIKLSKGEESNFIWSIFYTLLELVISELKIPEFDERSTSDFNQLEYVFIDDPVSSLDDNHLIEVASNLASIIKESNKEKLGLQFIITTHNPLFYNVLHNEFGNANKFRLEKLEDGTYELHAQRNDSPFSYHMFLRNELRTAINENRIQKYHFNFLRNLFEKTATFLGYVDWKDLLPREADDETKLSYAKRILDISSHSQYSGEEVSSLNPREKQMLIYLFESFDNTYHFNKERP